MASGGGIAHALEQGEVAAHLFAVGFVRLAGLVVYHHGLLVFELEAVGNVQVAGSGDGAFGLHNPFPTGGEVVFEARVGNNFAQGLQGFFAAGGEAGVLG